MEQKKTYQMDDAQKASEEYFGGDQLAARVWLSKYALKDSDGNLYERTPDDMHHRIAAELARIDRNYANPVDEKVFFDLLKDFKYIVPQGGP
ncbi:MAG: ribonucleoside-diphosphate reductase, adenosylcobalamin-dependent, partial [Bacteroidales bacterium]|nr:ribonucleoside-diphosphate reductase, adenosylcobalamin-dependent [Bacteroidales bacterium]